MHPSLPADGQLATPVAPIPGLRARVWIDSSALFRREEARDYCWLWLHREDGRVQAFRVDARALGRDELIEPLLRTSGVDPHRSIVVAESTFAAELLPQATAVPQLRWSHSWGHPLNEALRAFAATLDVDVLRALGRVECKGQFVGTTTNYNRLASVPPPIRQHRLQALAMFPPLVMPLLFSVLPDPELFEPCREDCDEPDSSSMAAAVLEAIDHGRDLIGALADYWRIGRALVRSSLLRESWPPVERFGTALRLMQSLPPSARPCSPAEVVPRFRLLMHLLGPSLSQRDVERLADRFSAGWTESWQEVSRENGGADLAVRDLHDFLIAAMDQEHFAHPRLELSPERLALAWIARRGAVALIRASRRWHALPAVTSVPHSSLPDHIAALLGACHERTARATELTSRAAVVAEGSAMHHCVGDYWKDCILAGTRIWHLEFDDGETATAEYCLNLASAEVKLSQLRGPQNRAPSDAMEDWAEQVCRALNADALLDRRRALVQTTLAARAKHGQQVPRETLRPFDLTLRRELAVVLAYCAQQEDWVVAAGTLYRGPVAGFFYGAGYQVLDQLQAGDPLQLVREPDNPHDPLAVRVDWRGRKLGYVPRAHNPPIAGRLDRGHALEAYIHAMDDDLECCGPVAISIRAGHAG